MKQGNVMRMSRKAISVFLVLLVLMLTFSMMPLHTVGTSSESEIPFEGMLSNSYVPSTTSSGALIAEMPEEIPAELMTESARVRSHLPTLYLNKAYARPGDVVQVIANIENNPGILGMTLALYYDETAVTLESVENGFAFRRILEFATSGIFGSGTRFVWDSFDVSPDNIRDGEVLILNFRIPSNAVQGRHIITMTYFCEDIIDRNLNSVPLQIENGYIEIIA